MRPAAGAGLAEKGLTVEGDLDRVDYYGNEELLEHIWSNLLSNAIRFTLRRTDHRGAAAGRG